MAAQRDAKRLKKEAERLAFEERRLQADLELQHQREAMYLQEKQESKSLAICNHLKQWNNSTDVEAYTNNFEVALEEAKYPVEEWLPILRKHLTGKALSVFLEVAPEKDTPYETVREEMLERLGATPQQASRTIWLTKPKADETPRSFLQQVSKAVTRLRPLLTGTEAAMDELFNGTLIRTFSEETLLHLKRSDSPSRYRKTEIIQELWESQLRTLRPNAQQQPQQKRRDGWIPRDRWTRDTPPTEGK